MVIVPKKAVTGSSTAEKSLIPNKEKAPERMKIKARRCVKVSYMTEKLPFNN